MLANHVLNLSAMALRLPRREDSLAESEEVCGVDALKYRVVEGWSGEGEEDVEVQVGDMVVIM